MKIPILIASASSLWSNPLPTWKMVHSLDSDHNDRISRTEFLSSDEIFERIDANKDGFLTQKEVTTARKKAAILKKKSPKPKISAVDLKTGKKVDLSKPGKATALIFGTYTWRPFIKQTGRLQELYQEYGKAIQFYWIYGQEARASDTGLDDSSDPTPLEPVANHRTPEERKKAASSCAKATAFKVPVLIDDLDNTVTTAFDAHPTRLFVLAADGTIAFHGGPGPVQTDLVAFEKALKELASQNKEE